MKFILKMKCKLKFQNAYIKALRSNKLIFYPIDTSRKQVLTYNLTSALCMTCTSKTWSSLPELSVIQTVLLRFRSRFFFKCSPPLLIFVN